jgi:hypothetical protein
VTRLNIRHLFVRHNRAGSADKIREHAERGNGKVGESHGREINWIPEFLFLRLKLVVDGRLARPSTELVRLLVRRGPPSGLIPNAIAVRLF